MAYQPNGYLDIIKAGLSTTVQDLGRPGYYHLGIPLSGAMDRFALVAANLLVGNDEGDAALEAVFMGPEIRFGADATVAVAGGENADDILAMTTRLLASHLGIQLCLCRHGRGRRWIYNPRRLGSAGIAIDRRTLQPR